MAVEYDSPDLVALSLTEAATACNDGPVQPLGVGSFNCVVRVGNTVLKSPLISDPEEKRALIESEAAVLKKLPGEVHLATGSTLNLPQLIASRPESEPPHNELSFVSGETLTIPGIVAFEEAEKARLGRDIGSFAAWLGDTIPPDKYGDIPPAPAMVCVDITTKLKEYRLPYVDVMRRNGCSSTADLVEELASGPPLEGLLISAHGDLRPANLTFYQRQLAGIFDFGNFTLTDPAEELRWTYFMGEVAARQAVWQYNHETRDEVTLGRVAHYACVQAMMVASRCAMNPDYANLPSFQRDFLNKHQPDRDWSELDRFGSRNA